MRRFSKATLVGGIALAAVVALALPEVADAAITSPAANATVSGTIQLSDNGAQSAGCSDLGGLSTSSGSTHMFIDQGAGTTNGTVVSGPLADSGTATIFSSPTVSSTAGSNPIGPLAFVTDNFGNGTYTVNSAEQATKSTLGIICGSGTLTNAKETITVSNTGQLLYGGATSGAPGQSVTVKATLTDQNNVAPANGIVVTFALGGGNTVTGTTVSGVASATLLVTGSPRNAVLTVTSPAGYFTAATTSPAFTVTKDPTTTTLSPLTGTDYGQTATFTATVASTLPGGLGTPTGSVQFTEDGNNFGSAVALNGSGVASISDATLPAGNHTIGAIYSGDNNFTGGSATPGTQVVAAAPTSTTITTSVEPSFFGQIITYTATVTATAVGPNTGVPTGTISFSTTPSGGASEPLGGAVTLVASGANSATASTSTALLPASSYVAMASYNPTANYAASNSTVPQIINPANTSVAVVSTLPAFSDFGQPVQFTATVTTQTPGNGSPTGSVTFIIDGSTANAITQGPFPLNSAGSEASSATSPSISTLSPGSHTIEAIYTNSDGNYQTGTNNTIIQFVAPDATTTVVSTVNNANPSVFGQGVSFQANVTPAFTSGGTPVGIVLFFVNPSSPVDCNNAPSSTFEETLVGGVATTPADSSLPVGSNTISACYFSSSSDFGASATANPQYVQVVNPDPTTTVLTSANTPGNESGPTVFGQPVTFTASVTANIPGSGVPTGTVTFSDGATVLGTENLSGGTTSDTATLETAALSVGSHAITAVFNPDNGNFVTSQQGINQTVNQDPTTTTVTQNGQSVQGQPVTFTATVVANAPGAGIPTGTVQFEINGANVLGGPVALTPLGDGSGSSATSAAISTLTPGTYAATAIYSGDVDFITSTNTLNQIVNPASTATTLTASPSPVIFGQPVTLTATVTPTGQGAGLPTGTVDFYDGTTLLGASAVQVVGGTEQASLAGLSLAVGTHSFTAVYLGEYDYAGSTSTAVTDGVSLIGTTTSVASSLNPSTFGASVTFTATVTPASNAGPGVSGTVTFKDGATVLGTSPVTLTGGKFVATLSETNFAVGSHSITASYSGAAVYTGSSTTSALAQVVNKDASSIAAQAFTSSNSMTATLTSAQGVPIAGQTLSFTTGTTALCTAVTAANGSATCTAQGLTGLNLVLAGSYTVTFAGNASYLGSTATAK